MQAGYAGGNRRTCATSQSRQQLGVGLHLYGPEEVVPPMAPQGPQLVPEPEGEEPGVPESNRLTRKQAEFIAKLARTNGLSKAEVDELARSRYGKSSSYLTVREASDFIKVLSSAA